MFASELERMAKWVSDFPDLETGGSLFGYWTNTGSPVIFLATGPGPHARHNIDSFFQDPEYMIDGQYEVWKYFAAQHIGEWHSHHTLGLAVPSQGDSSTMWNAIEETQWPRFLLGICNIKQLGPPREARVGFFLYNKESGTHQECETHVMRVRSPLDGFRSRMPEGEPRPQTTAPARIRPNRVHRPREGQSLRKLERETWYTEGQGQKRLMMEIQGLQTLEQKLGAQSASLPEGESIVLSLTMRDGRVASARLVEGFPARAPTFKLDGRPIRRRWRSDNLVAEHLYYLWHESVTDVR
jgi:hypothetical protein